VFLHEEWYDLKKNNRPGERTPDKARRFVNLSDESKTGQVIKILHSDIGRESGTLKPPSFKRGGTHTDWKNGPLCKVARGSRDLLHGWGDQRSMEDVFKPKRGSFSKPKSKVKERIFKQS